VRFAVPLVEVRGEAQPSEPSTPPTETTPAPPTPERPREVITFGVDAPCTASRDKLGATERASPRLAVTDLRVGDKLRVVLHWTFHVHPHICGRAASEVGVAYHFSSRTWHVSPRALATAPVPAAWLHDPRTGTLTASDAHLDLAQYAALSSRVLPEAMVDFEPE